MAGLRALRADHIRELDVVRCQLASRVVDSTLCPKG
jgi:hypothetical protein